MENSSTGKYRIADSSRYRWGNSCYQSTLVAEKFQFGDSISYNSSQWYADTVFVFYREDNCVYSRNTKSDYYLVGRINTTNDTSLFYIHLACDLIHYGTHDTLLDFAIEGFDSIIIISSINDLSTSHISISPNPFTSFINITSEKPFQYILSDYLGRVVMSGKSEKTIKTETLSSGSYLLTIKNEETFSIKKMVKY